MLASMRLLHHWSWWWHLFVIQKSLTLFQIMPIGVMDLAPLLYILRASERSPLLLLRGLPLPVPAISTISVVPAISTIGSIDFPIILLLI
jgi:hypothetical protein